MGELSGPREVDLAGGKGRAAAGEHGSVLRAGEGRRNTPESSGVGSGGEGFVGGGGSRERRAREGEGEAVLQGAFSLDGWMDGWMDVGWRASGARGDWCAITS